ncbi:hypothetical protein T310_0796 [Rasamsonia emersonii CBS 393.64]|uniref:Uncharacterized protein n=1 Tax=Rasamsonia emersonii (strain ATCC 16479 / CBS 393.64 / IMI 116815) TaxID=1408163 RepID=A0A0F4Z511_RASE3|nr:hypothetical protein T310_0796 [Rasamsonia emersonii CBS 393.64]KKA25156.1 hypothetical protein T310_0796 [Rasamsonia emersonii CBS 393.64]
MKRKIKGTYYTTVVAGSMRPRSRHTVQEVEIEVSTGNKHAHLFGSRCLRQRLPLQRRSIDRAEPGTGRGVQTRALIWFEMLKSSWLGTPYLGGTQQTLALESRLQQDVVHTSDVAPYAKSMSRPTRTCSSSCEINPRYKIDALAVLQQIAVHGDDVVNRHSIIVDLTSSYRTSQL